MARVTAEDLEPLDDETAVHVLENLEQLYGHAAELHAATFWRGKFPQELGPWLISTDEGAPQD